MSLLSVSNLTIAFGASTAVQDISLTIEKGELLALVGESGSGKSLTALSILKLLPPEARMTGIVHFDGTVISDLTDAAIAKYRGKRIAMVFQEPMSALNPLHTIDRQILEPLRMQENLPGSAAHAKLAELYEAVGLAHLLARGKLYPHQLSGGERQRAMIAMALACNPELIIADEPTTALDVTLQNQILALLKNLQAERGVAILLITHDLTVVRKIATRVAVMRQGQIVETATTAQLFAHPSHPYTRMLINAHPNGAPIPLVVDAQEIINATLSVHFPVKSGIFRRTTQVTTAVNAIHLRLRAGETLGVVGESGSGKSSLAYALLKLIKSTGPIVFMGERVDQLSAAQFRPLRKRLQIVFQDPYSSLNPRMTVGDIVAEGLRVHEPDVKNHTERVEAILTRVGLTADMAHRYPHEFSGGQRQRIAIARAMILRPALVILDEPTSALDMSVQGQVLDLLQQIQRDDHVSYLFISHDLRTVRAMAHRVLVMKKGTLVEEGSAEQIFAAPKQPYTQALMHAAFDVTL